MLIWRFLLNNYYRETLKQPPIDIRVIGDVKRLMHRIKSLKTKTRSVSSDRNTSTFLSNGVLSLPLETVIPTDDERAIIDESLVDLKLIYPCLCRIKVVAHLC
jgi:hypothetical protein